ncbi:hypothetical protein NDU88_005652 [Pleurodeles waltl]|uniref:Uncharacterized protein n=1 Tax=Pleurodeles waltl TaxID=8319 RepID=A0AAV7LN93_PLEWA|nr:hypothetical protein NDU88_005652 [Pleurodeles waltl]
MWDIVLPLDDSQHIEGWWGLRGPCARLRVVDECKIHIFPTPEDAWTSAHAKGLVEPYSGDPPEGTWLTPQPRRKKRTASKMRPSRAQAAMDQAKALLEATKLSSNPYAASTMTKYRTLIRPWVTPVAPRFLRRWARR